MFEGRQDGLGFRSGVEINSGGWQMTAAENKLQAFQSEPPRD
jgi:hypothetical protein